MSEEVIAHMRDRIERARRVIGMTNNPEIIGLLSGLIAEAEADIAKLEAEQDGPAMPMPPAAG